MSFTYTVRKEHLLKYLKERHRTTNIMCILFFVFLSVVINFKIFMNNKLLMTICLIGMVLLVTLLIVITNAIFTRIQIRTLERKKTTFGRHQVKIDEKHIEDTIHQNTFSVLWTEVRDVSMDERMIVVKPKNKRVNLVFYRDIIKNENFEELKKLIRKYYKR